MTQEAKVYISLEDGAGQLVIDGPLSLLDRLVATLSGRELHASTEPATPDQAAQL